MDKTNNAESEQGTSGLQVSKSEIIKIISYFITFRRVNTANN